VELAGRKIGLSLDEHIQVGGTLADVYDRIVMISVSVGNAFPVASSGGSATRDLDRVAGVLLRVRSELEEALYLDHPLQAVPSTYFPRAAAVPECVELGSTESVPGCQP
jgi:hypothetical protein